jgi:cytochrome c
MDNLLFNKIAGAVLSSLLVIVGLRTFVDILYPTGVQHGEQRPAIVVTQNPVPEEGVKGGQQQAQAGAPAQGSEPEQPVEAVLASVTPEAGEASVKKCAACHNWQKGGPSAVGPNLYGIVGGPIAKKAGFAYSSALQQKGGEWTFDNLSAFLANPKGWAPGTKMNYGGISKVEERAGIIAFLNQQSDNPLPIPGK